MVTVRKVESVSRVVLFSRAKTEGDRRIVSNLRGVVFTLHSPLCFQLVV